MGTFAWEFQPEANAQAIVQGENFRFTVLTESLLRLEYSEDGVFEDRATQSIWNRRFPVPKFTVNRSEKMLEIVTDHFHLYYTYGPFTKYSLWIDVKNNYSLYANRWYFGEKIETLKGTVRTLDFIDGAVELEDGIQAKNGYAVLDDSASNVLSDEETVRPRERKQIDLYFFAHGRDYKKGLRDFFQLTGRPPLLPRYTLGNWWSRFWEYDEKEYMELMDRFAAENIPIAVAVIDMDWHLVDIPAKYGSGWTGYTWNRKLFPDPERFLQWLKKRGLYITLNVHPADGVRPHEEMYEEMAKELGIDYENEEPIPFDLTDNDFREAYFIHLHHPQEKIGVDFWWVDWQQGSVSRMKNLDPLWLLNHYHSLDMLKRKKRPVILSRYAGVGSHRYPIGFSGDAIISWESLRFQPYFTATATNIGYTWWSHDIGGHFGGKRDDELALRWVQFGVFSPIMRLHSSKNPFSGKEPWNFPSHIADIYGEFMRLRHAFIPYLYTMNWRTSEKAEPLIQPLYYEYPHQEEAYEVPNEYFFGSELIVAPITEPVHSELQLASCDIWLPEGTWFDFFTGRAYTGNKKVRMFRGLDAIPVLAKEGAIVPLADLTAGENGVTNPKHFEVHIFPGTNNRFELYEDDGISLDFKKGNHAITNLLWDWDKSTFIIEAATGDRSFLPEVRHWKLHFRGVRPVNKVQIRVDGKVVEGTLAYDEKSATLTVVVTGVPSAANLAILFTEGIEQKEWSDDRERVFNLLQKAQISYAIKEKIYQVVTKHTDKFAIITELRMLDIDMDLLDALIEQLLD